MAALSIDSQDWKEVLLPIWALEMWVIIDVRIQLLGGLINYNYPLCCKPHHLTLRSSKTCLIPGTQHPPPPAEWNECKQREEETEDSWIICLSALGWNMTIKAILARVGPRSYSGCGSSGRLPSLQPGQCLRLRSDNCNCFVYPKISTTSSGAARLSVVTILPSYHCQPPTPPDICTRHY